MKVGALETGGASLHTAWQGLQVLKVFINFACFRDLVQLAKTSWLTADGRPFARARGCMVQLAALVLPLRFLSDAVGMEHVSIT